MERRTVNSPGTGRHNIELNRPRKEIAMTSDSHPSTPARLAKPLVLGAIAAVGLVAAYLSFNNSAQLGSYWPWLAVLLLPLLPVFLQRGPGGHGSMGGCGGHGSHGGSGGSSGPPAPKADPSGSAAPGASKDSNPGRHTGCCGGGEETHECGQRAKATGDQAPAKHAAGETGHHPH
jgi:hypothetical protein